VYARPKETAKVGPNCAARLTEIAAASEVIGTLKQYRPAASGRSEVAPADLPELSSTGAPRRFLLVRSTSAPARRWETSAIQALTGHHPERVIKRSVRAIGSPSGKIEVVVLKIV
jgi:hypothetical protein